MAPKDDDGKEEKVDSPGSVASRVLFRGDTFAAHHPLPDYEGDVCIITGGSTGIGKATCDAFLQAGAKAVYNLDICKPEMVKSEKRLHYCNVDVSKTDRLKAAISTIFDKEGHIDHLVSNAGVWVGGEPMENITEEEFDRVININVKGCFFAISSVVPFMRKQEKGGSIIIVGSDQSFIGKPYQNLYGMTKGAIGQLAKSTAIQVRLCKEVSSIFFISLTTSFDFDFCTVCPGRYPSKLRVPWYHRHSIDA